MALGTILVSLSLLLTPQTAPKEEELTEAKKADIAELLQITTAPVLGQLVAEIAIKDITESLRAVSPGIQPKAIDAATDETRLVTREFTNEFMKELYPLYNKHFTQAEIREVLAFHRSPLGQKFISASPLMAEARLLMEKKVKELYPRITQRVLERLKKEGIPF